MPDKVYKKIEIVKGFDSDFQKFSKISNFLSFELNAHHFSKENNCSNIIIPDECNDIKFELE